MAEDNAAQAVPAVEEEVVIDLSKPLEKVEQPNKAAVDAKVAELEKEIETMQQRRDRLAARIEATKKGNDEINTRVNDARAKFEALRAQHKALKEEKDALIATRDTSRQISDKLAEEMRAFNARNGGASAGAGGGGYGAGDLDARLRELELTQQTTTLSMSAEKELVRQIESLRAMKRGLAEAQAKLAAVSAAKEKSKTVDKELSGQIGSSIEQLKAIGAKMNEAFEEMKKLQLEREAGRGNFPALVKERDELRTAIGEKLGQKKGMLDAFYAQQRAYHAYIQMERKRRYLLAVKAREEAAAAAGAAGEGAEAVAKAGNAAAAALLGEGEDAAMFRPYAKELDQIELLTAYMQRMLPKAAPAAAAAAVPALSTAEKAAASGLKALKKDADPFGMAGKAKKGGKTAAGGAAGSSASQEVRHLPLNFAMETIVQLEGFGVAVPATTEDLEATIVALKQKKQHYEQLPPPELQQAKAAAAAGAQQTVAAGPKQGGFGRGTRPAAAAAAGAAAAAAGSGSSDDSLTGANAAHGGAGAVVPSKTVTVRTPYGLGSIAAVREDGSVVVQMKGFGATAFLQPSQLTVVH